LHKKHITVHNFLFKTTWSYF